MLDEGRLEGRCGWGSLLSVGGGRGCPRKREGDPTECEELSGDTSPAESSRSTQPTEVSKEEEEEEEEEVSATATPEEGDAEEEQVFSIIDVEGETTVELHAEGEELEILGEASTRGISGSEELAARPGWMSEATGLEAVEEPGVIRCCGEGAAPSKPTGLPLKACCWLSKDRC